MNDLSQTPAEVPQLRTLLLTDLCDSTRIVERLGDARAAELFRDHDRLVLRLQQRWRGRLIDRSDGLLLLFERPIDGLGFALDYERGLCELGTERQVVLTARAGLHVGEVLTWRNSDEAVRVGAKPLEVEGIAKPFAARLMAMARPGQILLSAVAEPLTYRAAREFGERGERLVWKHHGRWVFKGMPGTQEIFEVGEPGIAPLRTPRNNAKAWRAIPLWRRPAALAAELALLAGIAAGTWFALRPQPAIAFGERDWVVVGDLRNLTGQSVLDDSLEQAFRISLEQSRYVNVLSDLKARDTLARMRRAPNTVLDREVASEIALREGVRAVILPTVAEVGGRVRVSAEVIDPRTQTTVYAELADGRGINSTLDSIDAVTSALRTRLGEAIKSVERDSAPLPEVTTANLDALRAYALGQSAYAAGSFDQALGLYRRATQLDPEFALAWIGQVRVFYSHMSAPKALAPLERAQALKQRLATRERLYLAAWEAEFKAPGEALARWQELAKLYPDYWPALGNSVLGLLSRNRFEEALKIAKLTHRPQNELASLSFDDIGRAQLGLENYDEAAVAFDKAIAAGLKGSVRRRANAEAARRNFAGAEQLLAKTRPNDRYPLIDRISIEIDRGRWIPAQAYARQALELVGSGDDFDSRSFRLTSATVDALAGKSAAALDGAHATARLALAALGKPRDANQIGDAGLALAAALLAQRLGDHELAVTVLERLQSERTLMAYPALQESRAVLRANRYLKDGAPAEAVALLEPLLRGSERYQTRVALRDAYMAAGLHAKALAQARWLQRRRGLAYIELGFGQALQALNVADSNVALLSQAEALVSLGRFDAARSALAEFDRIWPEERLPGYLRTRRADVVVASSRGVV